MTFAAQTQFPIVLRKARKRTSGKKRDRGPCRGMGEGERMSVFALKDVVGRIKFNL